MSEAITQYCSQQAEEERQRIKLTVMSKEHALREWEVLCRYFEPALEHADGTYGLVDMRKWVENDTALALIAWDPEVQHIYAAFLVGVDDTPNKRVYKFISAGGEDIDMWAHLWPAFKAHAKSFGCDMIRVTGRRGWARFITADEVATIFTEDLSDG